MPTPTKTPTATFLRRDATTQGNWMGTYGAQGVVITQGPDWLPSDATISPLDESGWGVWNRSTTDPRALLTTWDTSHRVDPPAGGGLGLEPQLRGGRQPQGRPGARPGAVPARLGQRGPRRAGEDQRREDRRHPEHAVGLIVPVRAVPGLRGERARPDHDHQPGRPGRHPQRPVPRPRPDPDAPQPGDAGFEQVSVGAGQFQYRPTGSDWTFTGGAGIAGNDSGFTGGNPPAPRGRTGRLPARDRLVQPDDRRLGRRLLQAQLLGGPAGERPGVAAGLPGPGRRRRGGDLHALGHVVPILYHRRVHRRRRVAHDRLPGPGQRRRRQHRLRRRRHADQPGHDRRRGLRAGVGGGQPLPVPPERLALDLHRRRRHLGQQQRLHRGQPAGAAGAQVAFLQGTGAFSQAVTGWAAGSYTLTFRAAQRGNYQASRQDFEVLVDGAVVGSFTPSGTSYRPYTTAAFTVTAGSHTIAFRGLDSAGGDNTAFVDEVRIAPA